VGKTIYASVDGVPVGSGVTDGTGIAIVTYAIPNGAAAGLHNVTFTFDGSTDPVFRGSTRTAAVLEVF
jgi:hypothetical protein